MPAASAAATGVQAGSVANGWSDEIVFDLERFADDSADAGYTDIAAYDVKLYSLARDLDLGESDVPTLMNEFRIILPADSVDTTISKLSLLDDNNALSLIIGADTTSTNSLVNIDLVYGTHYYVKYAQCNIQKEFADTDFIACDMDDNETTVLNGYNSRFLYANVPEDVTNLAKVSASEANGIEMNWTIPSD